MTRSQLVAMAGMPKTLSTTATVNITSTSQGREATSIESRKIQDPPTNVEDVDLREYHSKSKGEHTMIAD